MATYPLHIRDAFLLKQLGVRTHDTDMRQAQRVALGTVGAKAKIGQSLSDLNLAAIKFRPACLQPAPPAISRPVL